MLCNIESGACGITTDTPKINNPIKTSSTVEIIYVTDPICSHCWAMEPAWRRFLFHFEGFIQWRHIYGGLLPSWQGFSDAGNGIGQPADVAPHWAEVAAHYGQPINPNVWLQDPPHSSFPASIAAHAVRIMAPEQEDSYLRRLRQAVFLEARNVARDDVLIDCAVDIGLDKARFSELWHTGIGKYGFERDLAEVKQLPVAGFPTLLFITNDGVAQILRGTQSFAHLQSALTKLLPELPPLENPNVTDALEKYQSGTTKEFAELLQLSFTETATVLLNAGAHQRQSSKETIWQA